MSVSPGVRVRPPAVAGTFYPAGPEVLVDALRRSFSEAQLPPPDAPVPKAIVVPHAGYVYSGPIAASAYLRLVAARAAIERVVVVGPSHRIPLAGMAVTSADALATPLGLVQVDVDARDVALASTAVTVDDLPHAAEHSLEVQLPFLQVVLDRFEVLPLVVGHCSTADVATVLDAVWGGAETVVVVSTDLSHYHRYDDADALDRQTAAAVVAADHARIRDTDACGAYGLRGLLAVAADRHLTVQQLDLRNSGDTAGDRDRVVGYGAFGIL